MALAASSNVMGQHAGPSFIPGQQPMLPSFAGNQFLAAYMQTPAQSYAGHSLPGHAPFWAGLVPGLTGHPAYQGQPFPGQAMSTLVTSAEHDSLRAEYNELKKSSDTLAVALESTQKTLRAVAKQAGAVKQTDGMFKIHAQGLIAAKPKPKKAAIAAPIYNIRTAEGQAAYDALIADWAKNNLDPERAMVEGSRVAEEVDEETLMAGASGAAATGAFTAKDIWQDFTNRGIAIKKDLLAHAKKCNHTFPPSTKSLPGRLLSIFEKNEKAYGFGFIQYVADPFSTADPVEVADFENFKVLNGLPAGAWDGTF